MLDTWDARTGDFIQHRRRDSACQSDMTGCPDYVGTTWNNDYQPQFNLSNSVGMLEIRFVRATGGRGEQKSATCTATIISYEAILTSDHCIDYFDKDGVEWQAQTVRLIMRYETPNLASTNNLPIYEVDPKPVIFDGTAQHSSQLDFAVLHVAGRQLPGKPLRRDEYPGPTYSVTPLMVEQPTEKATALFIVSHIGSRAKMFQQGCGIHVAPGLPLQDEIMRHRCSTDPGSSGALIFRESNKVSGQTVYYPVLAIHRAGPDPVVGLKQFYNEAVPLSYIIENAGRDKSGLTNDLTVRALDFLAKYWKKCLAGKCAQPPSLASGKSAGLFFNYAAFAGSPQRIFSDRDLNAAHESTRTMDPACSGAAGAAEMAPLSNVVSEQVPNRSGAGKELKITGFVVHGSIVCDDGARVQYDDVPSSELAAMLPISTGGAMTLKLPPEQNWSTYVRSRPGKAPQEALAHLISETHARISYSLVAPNIWRARAQERQWIAGISSGSAQRPINVCSQGLNDTYALPGAGVYQKLEQGGPFQSVETAASLRQCFDAPSVSTLAIDQEVVPGYAATIVQNMIPAQFARLRSASPSCGSRDDDTCTISFDRVDTYFNGNNSHPISRTHVEQTIKSVKSAGSLKVVEIEECEYAGSRPRRDTKEGAGKLCALIASEDRLAIPPVAKRITQYFDGTLGEVCENVLTDDGRNVVEENYKLDSWTSGSCNTLRHQ